MSFSVFSFFGLTGAGLGEDADEADEDEAEEECRDILIDMIAKAKSRPRGALSQRVLARCQEQLERLG